MAKEPIKIKINGVDVDTEKGATLIDVCRENDVNIPSFCYYKDLEVQASCRMCMVRIDKMPKLQTSCTIKCTDGMDVTTVSPEIEKAQRSMGEFLLANHPLDCPVCDRGGECELQEVIFDWGDVEERFTENKNAQPEKYLSPIVANDPQRCILCKRCTRVCHEWMGEDAIEAGNRGVNTVIGTYGGWLNCSECGNCIEVCPTGTLLDAVYRHETRPWELDQIISTDVYSSDGMQLSIGSRGGAVHRIVARDRYVDGLNGEFLDVKARFAHGFVNHADRIKTPMIRYKKGGRLIPATWDEAIATVAKRFADGDKSFGIVASPRLTNEAIFAMKRFAKEAQTDNFAIADRQNFAPVFANLSAPLATHHDIRHAATIVIIGGEPEEEQTYTAKQVRQAVRNDGAKLIVFNERAIALVHQTPGRFVHVNKGSIDAAAALFAGGDAGMLSAKLGVDRAEIDAAFATVDQTAGDLVIMFGSELSVDAQTAIAATASRFAGVGRRVLLHPLLPYNNTMGAFDIAGISKDVADVVASSEMLYIAGSLQDASGLAGKDFVVVQELFETETTAYADVVFPAASFAEIDGTYTNNAGNVQRVRKAIDPINQSRADWLITDRIAREMGAEFGYALSASAVFRDIAANVPAYAGLKYPDMKDESNPARANYAVNENAQVPDLNALVVGIPDGGEKDDTILPIGHKLFRLTTMTSKTPQFHLLAHGNPKPENLLLAPLEQFELDGTPKLVELVAEIGVEDRELVKI